MPETAASRALPALALSAAALGVGVGAAALVHELDGRGGFGDPTYLTAAAVAALAPSVGNLWLGETGDAATGAALRLGGVVALTYALENTSLVGPSGDGAGVAAIAGLVLYAGGLGYDVVTQIDNGDRGPVTLRPSRDGLALTVSL